MEIYKMNINLRRVDVDQLKFSTISLIIDESLNKTKRGKEEGILVALVLYNRHGNLIYKHKEDYDDMDIMIAGESFPGESLMAERWKTYICKPDMEYQTKSDKNKLVI